MTSAKLKKEKRLRKGFTIKEIDGELFYCHKYRDDSKWIPVQWSLKDLTEMLTPDGKLELKPLQSYGDKK